jgi:RNA polymerase sigma-70 factor (ECF subfamily)
METYGPQEGEPSVNPSEPDFWGEARRALQSLDPRLRIPLVLKEVEEMSVEEIAKTMGITQANVKVRLFRARRKLAGMLVNSKAAGSRGER